MLSLPFFAAATRADGSAYPVPGYIVEFGRYGVGIAVSSPLSHSETRSVAVCRHLEDIFCTECSARTVPCADALRNCWPVLAMHRRYPGRGSTSYQMLVVRCRCHVRSSSPAATTSRRGINPTSCLLWAERGMSRDGHINTRKPGQWATGKMAQMVGHRCATLYSVFCVLCRMLL